MRSLVLLSAVLLVAGCSAAGSNQTASEAVASPSAPTALPTGATDVMDRLAASPRHAEWVTVRTVAGDSVRAWVVFPERSRPAPIVIVVHEIFGLSHCCLLYTSPSPRD